MAGPARPALRVYPRVGGGNWAIIILLIIINGLSPRGRGKPQS